MGIASFSIACQNHSTSSKQFTRISRRSAASLSLQRKQSFEQRLFTPKESPLDICHWPHGLYTANKDLLSETCKAATSGCYESRDEFPNRNCNVEQRASYRPPYTAHGIVGIENGGIGGGEGVVCVVLLESFVVYRIFARSLFGNKSNFRFKVGIAWD